MNKASFKAKREGLGLSQPLMAELLNVTPRTIRRWESPSYDWVPPDDAWALLDEYQQKQDFVVQALIDKAEETHPHEVQLNYWFSEEQFEKAHPGLVKYTYRYLIAQSGRA